MIGIGRVAEGHPLSRSRTRRDGLRLDGAHNQIACTAVRLGVLDVGSNTVRLLVVDAHVGAAPVAASSIGTSLRLAELVVDGALTDEGAERLVACVREMRKHADELGVEDFVAFATSALRDATNGDQVLAT